MVWVQFLGWCCSSYMPPTTRQPTGMKMMKNKNNEFLATILEVSFWPTNFWDLFCFATHLNWGIRKIYFSIPYAHSFFFCFVLFWVRASDCLNIIKIKIKTLPKKITKNWYITERPCHIRRMGTHQMNKYKHKVNLIITIILVYNGSYKELVVQATHWPASRINTHSFKRRRKKRNNN